jgi:hypothetical protein
MGEPGASFATSGALDWDLREAKAGLEPSTSLLEFAARLGWRKLREGAIVATADGALRAASGVDAGVLDLADAHGGSVAVADLPRLGWDAGWFARSLSEGHWAARTETRFSPLSIGLDGLDLPMDASDIDLALACREQQDRWVDALRSSLQRSPHRPTALLLGPWVAPLTDTAQELTQALGVEVGECLSPPFGLAGERFEAGRWLLCECDGVQASEINVERLLVEEHGVTAAAGGQQFEAQGCVLAIGGVSGGGILFDERQRLRPSLVLEPPVSLWLDSKPWLDVAALGGVDVSAFGLHSLQAVGMDPNQVPPRLAIAGDLIADAPRTCLRAAQSGLDAVARLLERRS